MCVREESPSPLDTLTNTEYTVSQIGVGTPMPAKARRPEATESCVMDDAWSAELLGGKPGMIQFPLPLQSEREAVLEEAWRLLCTNPTSFVVAYLPVLARHAQPVEQPSQAPRQPAQGSIRLHSA